MAGSLRPILETIAPGSARQFDVLDVDTCITVSVYRDFDGNTTILNIPVEKLALRIVVYNNEPRVASFASVRTEIAAHNPLVRWSDIKRLNGTIMAFVGVLFNGTLGAYACWGRPAGSTGRHQCIDVHSMREQFIAASAQGRAADSSGAEDDSYSDSASDSDEGGPVSPRAPRRGAYAGDFSTAEAFARLCEDDDDIVDVDDSDCVIVSAH
jgi:hypothetical protein